MIVSRAYFQQSKCNPSSRCSCRGPFPVAMVSVFSVSSRGRRVPFVAGNREFSLPRERVRPRSYVAQRSLSECVRDNVLEVEVNGMVQLSS